MFFKMERAGREEDLGSGGGMFFISFFCLCAIPIIMIMKSDILNLWTWNLTWIPPSNIILIWEILAVFYGGEIVKSIAAKLIYYAKEDKGIKTEVKIRETAIEGLQIETEEFSLSVDYYVENIVEHRF